MQVIAFRTSLLACLLGFGGTLLDHEPLMLLGLALCVVGLVAFVAALWVACTECDQFELELLLNCPEPLHALRGSSNSIATERAAP